MNQNVIKLFAAIVISELAGVIGSVFTFNSVRTWYLTLEKPVLNPPSWVFGPVWTTLYLLMGISAFLIWKRGLQNRDVKVALVIFLFQLILNTLWSIIFFGLQNPFLAFFEIIILWLAILVTIVRFYRISKVAALLLVPYILWVTFASYLTFAIWRLN